MTPQIHSECKMQIFIMLKQVVHIATTVKGLKRRQWDSSPPVHTSFVWNIQTSGRGSSVNGLTLAVMNIS
jgi:hypothetical protein